VCQTGGTNGSTVTLVAAGTCTVDADQAGNVTYLAAPRVSQSFWVSNAGAPGAPTIISATPGNTSATLMFVAPASTGTTPISAYTATCNPGAHAATGAGSPLTITGLVNATQHSCSVYATNASGNGPPSAPVNVTPTDLVLNTVVSRKTHGTAGTFDLAIDTAQPIGGALTVEPRAIGAGHQIVFRFSGPVTAPGTPSALNAALAPVGTAVAASAGNDVIVTLTGVPDAQRLTVGLAGVNNALTLSAALGFLVGDVNNSRSVSATDILQVKGRSGQPADSSNFRFDLNASGAVTATDILVVKGRSGTVLP
jgi:hypothetical protein